MTVPTKMTFILTATIHVVKPKSTVIQENSSLLESSVYAFRVCSILSGVVNLSVVESR